MNCSLQAKIYGPEDIAEIERANECQDVLICAPFVWPYLNSFITDKIGLEENFTIIGSEATFDRIQCCSFSWFFLSPELNNLRDSHYSWKLNPLCTYLKKGSIKHAGGFFPGYHSLSSIYADLGFRMLRSGLLIKSYSVQNLPFNYDNIDNYTHSKLSDDVLFLKRHLSYLNYMTFCLSYPSAMAYAFLKVNTPQLRFTIKNNSLITKLRRINNYSAIIPTLNRYDYIAKAIWSLLNCNCPPDEIIVVDQTPKEERIIDYYTAFPSDIVKVFFLDEAGQASARNFAVSKCSADWVLLFDDDSEAWPEMTENHIRLLEHSKADVSTGISLAPWKDLSYISAENSFIKMADVLDTGNAMIAKSAFSAVGGLDLAFDKGSGVDDNLGRRLYLNGFLILFNPGAIRTHHKAPKGGLRAHGSWWTNKTLWWKELPVKTFTYNMMCFYQKKHWIPLMIYWYIRSLSRNQWHESILNIFLAPYKFVMSLIKGNRLYRLFRNN